MSDRPQAWATASLVVGLLLAGCDGAKLCRQCERPPQAPQTVQVEVDWQKLADALKDAGVGSTTVRTETVNMTVNPQQPTRGSKTVQVEGWKKMVEALESIKTASQSASGSETTHHIHHATFAFRFAPPWFNADQRSLFTSYVVFPVEAKFEEWVGRQDEGCAGEDAPASVCPDTAFYEKAMVPFLKGLSQCATTKKVELHLVGFASSTQLKVPLEDGSQEELELERRYGERINSKLGDCRGDGGPDTSDSDKFNLLIANERAVNAAKMLEQLVPKESKNAFAIEVIPWCSHAAMVEERGHNDGGDPAKGLMNRRAEVRLAALPGCLNVEPDKRVPTVSEDLPKAAEAE